MSTDSPIKYNPDRVLTEAQKEINDDHRYWDWFDAWWAQDFSWWVEEKDREKGAKPKGLAAHQTENSEQTLQDYWHEEEDKLIPFACRTWTRFHLPPHDLDGNLSEKPFSYVDWKQPEWKDWKECILKKIINATSFPMPAPNHGAYCIGICYPGYFTFHFGQENRAVNFFSEWCLYGPVLTFTQNCFVKNARFLYCCFRTFTNFENVTFEERTSFSGSLFSGNTSFSSTHNDDSKTRQSPSMNFSSAVFIGDVEFIDRKFGKNTSFSNTRFHSLAQFHNVTFQQAIDFSESVFRLPEYERLEGTGGVKWHWRNPASSTTYGYNPAYKFQHSFQILRQIMESLGNHEQKLRFSKLEMQARERRVGSKDVPWWVRWLSRGYGLSSDYGQSALRPFLWLIGFYIIASGIYYFLAGEWASPEAAMTVAFQYSLPPVSTFAAQFFTGEVDQSFINALLDHPFLTRLVMVAHGVTSLALVFFLLLALKRRFQIR
ncbi:MAG: hypothetical protein COA85_06555 [Robiginitomaculum sp.]|nr:MAG: hypothetical protein COA85_06555 [Robiginitomaculum sp.]